MRCELFVAKEICSKKRAREGVHLISCEQKSRSEKEKAGKMSVVTNHGKPDAARGEKGSDNEKSQVASVTISGR